MPDAAEVVLGEFVALDPEFAGAAAVELYVPDGEEFLISAGGRGAPEQPAPAPRADDGDAPLAA
ncbi:MAG: hypothetical protein H7287_03885 [Thermoleophilia bacterium]|nr:hypothetical protein [Thermoleophilia bacterium]